MSQFLLPNDTAPLVEQAVAQCQHLGLQLEKYVRRAVIEKETGEERFAWMQQVADSWNRRADLALWAQIDARWQSVSLGLNATTWTMTLIDRLIVGLGHNSVLETGLTLHHTWGIPLLPGSALKGLARAWATLEDVPLSDIAQVFGSAPETTPLTSGDVVFLDALPLAGPGRVELAVDIMNPHYPDYYRDPTQPPAGYLSPIPVFFLTVRGGTWRFGVAPRRGVPYSRAHESTRRAQEWLNAGLEHLGAGGKTSAGYGYFEIQQGDRVAPPGAQAAAIEPTPLARPTAPPTTPARTTLTILRVDANRSAYRVEPRADALPKIAQQQHIPPDTLRDTSTRWFLPLDAFGQSYGKRATTPPCEVERVDRDEDGLMIWMRPAPRKESGGS